MGAWLAVAILILPALLPTLLSVVLTLRWRQRRHRTDWQPRASTYLVIVVLAGLGVVLCLVMLGASLAVAGSMGDTAEGQACSEGVSSACGGGTFLYFVYVILIVLWLSDLAALWGVEKLRRGTTSAASL